MFPRPPFGPPRHASASDRAACAAAIRAGSKSFHAASRLLPARVRADAFALYAFCRLADDLVDVEGTAGAPAALRQRLLAACAGRPGDHPIDRAFADMVARTGLPETLPLALIEGLEWDERGVRCETLSDVLAYAARVAGSVGAMMAWIMGVRDAETCGRATDLGLAMQLTNIARDVGEDARAGRLYLPRAWLRAEGVDADVFLAAPAFSPGIGRCVARLLDEADRLYARAEAGIARLPGNCRAAIMAARLIYAAIGDEIRRTGCDSMRTRAVVPARRKLALAARALWQSPAAAREALTAPPEAEAAYLVRAVAEAPGPATHLPLTDRIVWVAALFRDLQDRTHAPRPRPSRRTAMGPAE